MSLFNCELFEIRDPNLAVTSVSRRKEKREAEREEFLFPFTVEEAETQRLKACLYAVSLLPALKYDTEA